MVKEIYQCDIPVFPNVGDCDFYVVTFCSKNSIKELVFDELLNISHVTKYSIEGLGECIFYSFDKFCTAYNNNGMCEFDEIRDCKYINSTIINRYDNGEIAFISDDIDELKQFVVNMFIYEREKEFQQHKNK